MRTNPKARSDRIPVTRSFASSRHDADNLANAFECAMPVVRRTGRRAAPPRNLTERPYHLRRVGS